MRVKQEIDLPEKLTVNTQRVIILQIMSILMNTLLYHFRLVTSDYDFKKTFKPDLPIFRKNTDLRHWVMYPEPKSVFYIWFMALPYFKVKTERQYQRW